jgi:hypothetical protein
MDDMRLPGDPHGIEEAHDVLAADEFAMPARGDYGLHLPRDPHGIEEAHDVLAADEFGFPAGPDRPAGTLKGGGAPNPVVVLGATALAVLLYRAVKRR